MKESEISSRAATSYQEAPPETKMPEAHDRDSESELSFESSYENLLKQSEKLGREYTSTIQLGRVFNYGAQTLLDQYGAENFFDLIEATGKQKGGNFNLYDLILNLEPDAKKRLALYDQMETDLQDAYKEYIDWSNDRGENRDANKYDVLATPRAGAELNITLLRAQDSAWERLKSKLFENSDPILNSIDLGFFSRMPAEERQEVKQKLAAVNNSIVEFVANNAPNNLEDQKVFSEEVAEFEAKLLRQIERKSREMELKFEEIRNNLMADIGKMFNTEFTSEEMKTAALNAARTVEKQIAEGAEKLKESIAKSTEKERALLGSARNLHEIPLG